MKRALLLTVVIAGSAQSALAQIPVTDPGNLAQAILIAERTRREYEALLAQYETLVRMSRPLGTLERYRIPAVPTGNHDVGRWEYGGPWLHALNNGDPRGVAYAASTRRLTPPTAFLQQLPEPARRAIEAAYATVEITDALAQAGGHQIGTSRLYSDRLQRAIDALEADVLSPAAEQHEMTAVLDKVAAGALIGRRQDMAANQLLSHALEQLVARNKRLRDAEAAAMNMQIGALRDGRAASSSIVRGAADDLRNWRQP